MITYCRIALGGFPDCVIIRRGYQWQFLRNHGTFISAQLVRISGVRQPIGKGTCLFVFPVRRSCRLSVWQISGSARNFFQHIIKVLTFKSPMKTYGRLFPGRSTGYEPCELRTRGRKRAQPRFKVRHMHVTHIRTPTCETRTHTCFVQPAPNFLYLSSN